MEIHVDKAVTKRLVRGCYGGAELGLSVPSEKEGSYPDPHCSYNVNQTPNSSETVSSATQSDHTYAKGFYGRQGSQDNKHADYFVTDCTPRPDGKGIIADKDCKLDGLTADGYTATSLCASSKDKSGLSKLMTESKWSKVHLSNDLEATSVAAGAVVGIVFTPIGSAIGAGIGKAVYEINKTKVSELYLDSKENELKIQRLPLRKAMKNSAEKLSYDCSNRKVASENYPDRCGKGGNVAGSIAGGSGKGADDTPTGQLRDRCNAEEFTLQSSCGVTGLMNTTAFRDPRLLGPEDKDTSDAKKLSNEANDSIGWKDVQVENQEVCCLGAGTFIQSRRPMGEACTKHGDCVETTVDENKVTKATNIKCFDDEDPTKYVKDGGTGTCRREKPKTCFDRLVFRSKYTPANYGYVLATDFKKCNYRLPVAQNKVQKKESSDPKRLEVQGNTSPHPRTCDPNWSTYYSKNHMHLPSWVKGCSLHFETFCQEVVGGKPRWQHDNKIGRICKAWVVGRQVSGKKERTTKITAKTYANKLLLKMCDRADKKGSLVNDMIAFCNERVEHANEPCMHDTKYCPRWKTKVWGGFANGEPQFCELLSRHYPVQYDRLIWAYCDKHKYDESCDCLAGEYVDPNATRREPTDTVPCGEAYVCEDLDGKDTGIRAGDECGKCSDATVKTQQECKDGGKTWTRYNWAKKKHILPDSRYQRRLFTCNTYNGNTVKQVGTRNRNLWMDTCNVAMGDGLLSHVLMPRYKWAPSYGKVCTINPSEEEYQAEKQTLDMCPLSEYNCEKQDDIPNICINMIDVRNQTCIAVGGSVCTSFQNVSQVNNCGFGDIVKKQDDCYKKPECKKSGCSFSFTEEPIVDSKLKNIECVTVDDCPKPSDCTGDCSTMCFGNKGQNCIGNKCTNQKGTCRRVKQTCASKEKIKKMKKTEQNTRNREVQCPMGQGWDGEQNKCVSNHKTSTLDVLKYKKHMEAVHRANARTCGCAPGLGYNGQECVEGYKTSHAEAVACQMKKDHAYNAACCQDKNKGWTPDQLDDGVLFSKQYASKICKLAVQTDKDTADRCTAENERLHKEHVRLTEKRNVICCGHKSIGRKNDHCLEGEETSLEEANKCLQTQWRRQWRPNDFVFLTPLVLSVLAPFLLATNWKHKKTAMTLLIILGVLGAAGWGGATAVEKA